TGPAGLPILIGTLLVGAATAAGAALLTFKNRSAEATKELERKKLAALGARDALDKLREKNKDLSDEERALAEEIQDNAEALLNRADALRTQRLRRSGGEALASDLESTQRERDLKLEIEKIDKRILDLR